MIVSLVASKLNHASLLFVNSQFIGLLVDSVAPALVALVIIEQVSSVFIVKTVLSTQLLFTGGQ